MPGQSDFVGMNASAVSLSSTTEFAIAEYAAPADEDIDLVLGSFSFGTIGANNKKVLCRIYRGSNAVTGSPTTETMTAAGRATPTIGAGTGVFKSGGTIPGTKGDLVFRESVSQSAGYSSPQVIGIAKNTKILITAQCVASDTAEVYFRGVFRKPSLQ